MNTRKLYGGLEAGGTKFNCVVASDPHQVLARTSFPTTSPAETIGRVIEFFRMAAHKHGTLDALGIASFGPVDRNPDSATYGHITATPKPGWSRTDLLGQLNAELNIPMTFDTDVNGAALGEGALGAAQGLDNYVYVTIGTGIGAGVVAGGIPVNGASHPEVGHILVPRDPEDLHFKGVCPYHSNCLEGLAAGPAITRRWDYPAPDLPPEHPAWPIQARYLATMCLTLTLCYSPQKIILGGGVMQQAHLFPLIRKYFKTLINGYKEGPSTGDLDNFIVAPGLGSTAGETGSIIMAQQAQKHAL